MPHDPTATRPSRSLRKASLLVLVGAGLAVALASRRAGARIEGNTSATLDAVLASEGANGTRIEVNGATLAVQAVHVPLPRSVVETRVEAACDDHAEDVPAMVARLASGDAAAHGEGGHPGVGLLRDRRKATTSIACFATGAAVDERGLAARLGEVVRTGDLAALGELRYAVIKDGDGGGAFVTVARSEGPVRLNDMFPATGDAPGRDPGVAPRPEGARRVLNVGARGAKYSIHAYESAHAPAAAIARYRASLRGTALTEVPAADDRSLGLLGPGVDVVVGAEPHGAGSVVSVVESATPAMAVAR